MGWMDQPIVDGNTGDTTWTPPDRVVADAPMPTEVAFLVTMAPIVLCVGFLLVRAAVIRTKPAAEREVARRALGVWPRLMIVFTFGWSGLLTAGLAWLVGEGAQIEASSALAYWTFGPILTLWMIYFAAKWVRQGAKVE